MKRTRLLAALPVAIAPLLISLTAVPARAQTAPPTAAVAPACTAPAELTRLGHALTRTGRRLAAGEPVKIVAIGSSSTAGAGASSPAASYPSRLEAELKARYPGIPITVLNRGVNGEITSDMIARFDSAVLAEHPDLVLWQVGTNAVLRDQSVPGQAPLIQDGVRRLKTAGADVVLIDPQYAPKVLAKPDIDRMVALIGAESKGESTGLFQRFAIMRHWHEVQNIPFDAVLVPDGLHMNDWSYGCIARLLGIAIAEATRSPAVAGVPTRTR